MIINIILFLSTTLIYYLYIQNSIPIYLFATTLLQCIANISTGKNIGYSILYTLLPWLFIFGVVLYAINVFPWFAYPFADVFGYYAIASSANTLLHNMMGKTDDLILNIYSNPSLLINQINVANFEEYWTQMQTMSSASSYKDELFALIQRKELIGKYAWYIYTGILTICIVQLNLSTYIGGNTTSQLEYSQFTQTETDANNSVKTYKLN